MAARRVISKVGRGEDRILAGLASVWPGSHLLCEPRACRRADHNSHQGGVDPGA